MSRAQDNHLFVEFQNFGFYQESHQKGKILWPIEQEIVYNLFHLHDINYNFEFNSFHFCRSVGQATAAFVLAVLEGNTKPGVWFPEEVYTHTHIFYLYKHSITLLDPSCSLKELQSKQGKFFSNVQHKEHSISKLTSIDLIWLVYIYI